jgi:hypothetical protein
MLTFLMKKAGCTLPITASDISVQELRRMIAQNPAATPNVIFEKA